MGITSLSQQLAGNLVGTQLVADRRERAIEMVLDGKHVARELRGGVTGRLILLGFQPSTDVLGFCRGIQCLRLRLLELTLQFCDAVVLGDLRRAFGRLLADFFRFLVKVSVVLRSFCHAINLVSAFAVKSTMGTTRA